MKVKLCIIPNLNESDRGEKIPGDLDVYLGAAGFWSESHIPGSGPTFTLLKPEIVFINQHGIRLKGFESIGFDKNGREQFQFREWSCLVKKAQ